MSITGCVLLAACGSGSSAAPTLAPTATAAPKVYVMSTSIGQRFLRSVVAAYDLGDTEKAKRQCSEGGLQLASANLRNVGVTRDQSGFIDYDTLEAFCKDVEAKGWDAVRDAGHRAIGQ